MSLCCLLPQQTPDITNAAFFAGHAEPVSALNHPMERSSRKLKSENRVCPFSALFAALE